MPDYKKLSELNLANSVEDVDLIDVSVYQDGGGYVSNAVSIGTLWNNSNASSIFLKIDASNDPITSDLAINGTVSATTLIVNSAYSLPSSDGSNGDVITTNGAGTVTWETPSAGVVKASIGLTIDGGGSVITTGIKGYLSVPYSCTINDWTLLADQSGSIVIDVWKDVFANYPPTDADSITNGAEPTLTSEASNVGSVATWSNVTVATGDTIVFNVDSVATVTKTTLVLGVTK